MGNFNYHFDEKAIQKGTDHPENSGNALKHFEEDGKNSWRRMYYLITTTRKDLTKNVGTVGIIRKNDHGIIIIFRKERSIKTNHDIKKQNQFIYLPNLSPHSPAFTEITKCH